jgi:U3 small nucleolar RNA-associated protein 18
VILFCTEKKRYEYWSFSNHSKCVIQTVKFHPTSSIMLAGGFDKTLRFFQIDGKTNPKIQSIYFQDMPIHSAEFSPDGKEVIVSGRRKFFYHIDMEQGRVEKVISIQGNLFLCYLLIQI